jgi:hypothetical protein
MTSSRSQHNEDGDDVGNLLFSKRFNLSGETNERQRGKSQ